MTSVSGTRRKSRREAGLTLVEVIVAASVVALVVVATAVSLGGVFGARLDASANKLSGMMRYAYSLATLEGRVFRVVIDVEGGTYGIERVEERKECRLVSEESEEQLNVSGGKGQGGDDDEETLAVTGEQVKDTRVRNEKLPGGIQFTGVYTKHNSSPVEGGTESIYFFPDGTAEKAFVWLSDGDEEFTVEVTALRGTGIVHSEALDFQELSRR